MSYLWKTYVLSYVLSEFGSYYVCGVGWPFVDSFKDLGILVDTELNFMDALDP